MLRPRTLAALSFVAIVLAPALAAQAVAIRTPSTAAGPRVAARPAVEAMRAAGRIAVDGVLDEADWRRVAAASDFRQRAPLEGEPSTERTEVRVLVDDDALYVGAWLWDRHADSIVAPLGRRDGFPPSDAFYLQLDSYRDRRTAFVFVVTPSGVKGDLLISEGSTTDATWDAVWDAATARDSLGWYAELRIPLSQLRFAAPDAGRLLWGANFLRFIARRNEDAQWSLIPATSDAWVSHYGDLRAPAPTRRGRRFEAVPYSSGRVARGARADAGATLGADVRLGIGSNLTLAVAANPDFGQVEADPSEVNLGAFETFRAERRPFFVEGTDIFRVTTGEWYEQGGGLFYSRRVGRAPQGVVPDDAERVEMPVAARLLGAAKLSGKTGGGWSLGALAAVTADERARWRDGAGAEHATVVEPRTRYGVLRVARDWRGGQSALGAVLTGTQRELGDRVSLAEVRADAVVGGVDARHRWRDGRYEATGFAVGSRVRGSAAAITATQRASAHFFQRPDAAHLTLDTAATSLGGWAAGASVGKGTGFLRLYLSGRAFSPGYEANDLGFNPRADYAVQYASVGLDQVRPSRYARRWFAYLNQWTTWSMGAERQYARYQLIGEVQLPSWWTVFGGVNVEPPGGLMTDALRGGPAVRTPGFIGLPLRVTSDRRKPVALVADGFHWAERGVGGAARWRVAPGVTLRPSPRAELTLQPALMRTRNPWQYVDQPARVDAPDQRAYVVGDLRQTTVSLAARGGLTFTPALTLQFHAEPFLSGGAYARFREVDRPRAPRFDDRFARLEPVQIAWDAAAEQYRVDRNGDGRADYAFGRPDFASRQLNANAVLRWEYRAGSTLHAVWTHGRTSDGDDGRFALGPEARALWGARGTNTLLVKASWWVSL